MSYKLSSIEQAALQNYVLVLLKVSKKPIHCSDVIPPEFDTFPEFAEIIPGLKFDKRTGWFSLANTETSYNWF